LILMLTAIIGFLLNKNLTAAISTTGILIIASILVGWKAPIERPDPANGLIAIEQSPYGEIKIFNNENERYLLIDGGIHSMADTTTWNSYAHYNGVMDLPKYFFVQPGKMLLLGLGGGSLVKQYFRDGWTVDAVDIDPVVIRMAYQYFGLSKIEGNVIEMDARQYLLTSEKKYDVILIDVYGSSSIPFHLVTEEAFGLIEKHLSKDGIAAVNVESVGWDDKIIATLGKTLKQKFANILALPMEEPPDQFGNIVILAANRELKPWREPERNEDFNPDWRYGPGYQKVHAWDNRFVPDMLNSKVLTDDLNPIDVYSEAINLASRKSLHSYFEQIGMR
jgi:spermidine synthase